jgi:hypothetical protein
MPSRSEDLTRELCAALLAQAGTVHADDGAAAPAGYLGFEPDPDHADALVALGLLGELASEPCLLSLHLAPPTVGDALRFLQAQLGLRLTQPAAPEPPPVPRAWLLCAERPTATLAALGLEAVTSLSAGVYASAPALGLGAIALDELPTERSTLTLRLLGRGAVLARALDELVALPVGSPERRVALPLLAKLRFELAGEPGGDPEEQELIMALKPTFDEFVRQSEQRALELGFRKGLEKGTSKGLEQGLEQGTAKGLEQGLEQGIEQGVASGLRSALLALYEARFSAVPDEVRLAAEAEVDAEVLRRWVVLAASADEPAARDGIAGATE